MQSDTDSVEEPPDANNVTHIYSSQSGGYNNNKPETNQQFKSWRSNGIVNKVNHAEQHLQQQIPTNLRNNSLTVNAKNLESSTYYGSTNNIRAAERRSQNDGNGGRNNNNNNNNNNNFGRHDTPENCKTGVATFSDDLRISKILRRLLGENNPHRAQELCQKLEVAVRSPTNTAYICRSFDFLLDSMQTLLKQCPEEILQQASIILGIIGYINHNDFPIYKNYLTKSYQSCKELQKYIMLALRTTIKADATNLDLMVYSERMLIVLKDYLENADKAEDFIAVSETMAAFAKNYTRSFENHFTDVVDIIVGWHLEADQTQALKQHCSTVLQNFSCYFLKALNFTLGLLGQFLEDLLVVGEELKVENSSLQSKEKAEIRVGAFVGAFNSICKALTTKKQIIIWSAGRQVIDETFKVILDLFIKTLSAGLSSEDTVLQINDFLYLLFSHGYKQQPQEQLQIQEVVMLQLKQMPKYTKQQTCSLLCLILCLIRQQRTNLPCTMVTLLFEPNAENSLCVLHYSNDAKLYRLLLAIYHEVLMIKNVPLLQEAYKYMLMDIMKHMEILASTENENVQQLQAATKLNFYLSALSALATQTSSIIGMYALNPSILELIINEFRASYMPLWCKHDILHGALLQLLIIHCKKNHNFRTSSRVLHSITDEVNISRTGEHFGLILQFLGDILSQCQLLASENLIQLLDWLQILLVECEQNMHVLVTKQHFQQICLALGQTALLAALPSAKCMEILLKYAALNMLPHVLHNWSLVIVQNLDSLNMQVQHSYSILLAYMPIQILLKDGAHARQRFEKLNGLQNWYKATSLFASLQARYMKSFLEILEDSNINALKLYEEFSKMFNTSWILQFREKGLQYEQEVNKSLLLLTSWLQHEVARICVRNKLRTPLGKPQDTFLGIEALIMKFARLLNMENTVKKSNTNTFHEKICTQTKVRLLLGFLDCLEKQIYNAAEGTAFALLAVEKPAKTFFRLNINTCKSWFQRIRFGVNLLAAKCLQPEIVIRYAQCMLMKEEQPLESTILALANALLACQESDTLHGLYAWLKSKTGQRYVWLQHAAEQAAGRRELAADGYTVMLQGKHDKLSLPVQEFVQNQLLDCYYHSGQWTRMNNKLSENSSWSILSNYRRQSHLKTLDALIFGPKAAYEEQLLLFGACETSCQALLKLTEWPDTLNVSETVEFSYMETIKNLEDVCMLYVLQRHRNKQAVVNDIIPAVQQALRESLRYEQQPVIGDLLLLNKVTHAIMHENVSINSNYFNCMQMQDEISCSLLTKSLLWTQLFNVAARERGVPVQTPCRHFLDLAASARLDGNENYCSALLRRCLQIKGYNQSLPEFSAALQNSKFILNLADGELLRACSELTQCMWSNSNNQMEAINLSAAICNQMLDHMMIIPQPKQSAQMLLALAEWITPRAVLANSNNNSNNTNFEAINSLPLQRLLNHLPEVPVIDVHIAIPVAEKAVGKLLNASILQHNDAGEAWCAFGNWCYRWGKKLVEANNNGCETELRRGKLSDNDMMDIRSILGEEIDPQTLQQLTEALENLQLHDGLEDIETSEISTMEIIESELRKIEVLSQRPVEQINSIIEIWRNAHKSVFAYYELATKSYFKYLALESGCNLSDASFVTTTLRILRLVVKHAIGLQDTLEDGLKTTPLRPWRAIIPQLFSRLNHHESYVRKSVAELLCRLASDRPHLVIFPAVVGAQQELRVTGSEDINNQLSNCFGTLVSTLQQQAPDAVLHVQLLVKELKRVALLWEEYWMNSLAQLYAEYTPLFNAFDLEVKKYGEKHLERLNAKYAILMQHVLSDFKKIANGTAKTCETNYERNFQERFRDLIANTMIALQRPLNLSKPNEHWLTIKQLYNVFQQRALRSTSSTYKVLDLSPVLATMQNTAISMPGVDTFDREPIYIRAVENAVHVLPTKTRPKKLVFLGSDGRKYTYLFKGLEDLHLDERIMQFLSIANAMMARSTANSMTKDVSGFRAQYYSVIPLGPQSGLISWVDGLIPLFSIYKKWQQRDALLKQQQKERPNGQTNPQLQQQQPNNLPAPTRPSEIFYHKLTPLLTEQNIKITDTRKQWPLATLRRVLKELSEETPRDLLAKELWCFANNASDWRKSVRCYAKSVAVMSVIGYVIGLGDRHLDNVLIRLSTGEIVHIDYNVCFEKGKTLRVPEKVPFRMTPNIEEALGLTGIEGAFRLGCEHVLKTLRKERETLLTLLEAFVYDPLVDWTVGDDGSATATRTTSAHSAAQTMLALNDTVSVMAVGKDSDAGKSHETNTRKEDWQLTRQNIHMRLSELKPYWTKYKTEATMKLNKINNYIEELLRKREDIAISERQRDNISKELALIHELETLGTARGSHGLNSITQRYALYKQSANAFNNSKKRVQQFQKEYEQVLNLYFDCVLMARTTTAGDLFTLREQLCQQPPSVPCNELTDLQVALEQYGHKQLYELYEFSRKEMENTLVQQTRSAISCLEFLIQYTKIMQYYSPKRLQQHRCVKYAQWYRRLFEEELEPFALRRELELCNEWENKPAEAHEKTAALQFVEAMAERWNTLNYSLHNEIVELRELEHENSELDFESSIKALQRFYCLNMQVHNIALQSACCQLLAKTHEAFLQYEQNTFKQRENILLDQQLNYSHMVRTMLETVYTKNIDAQEYVALKALHATLTAVIKFKRTLEILVPEVLLKLYIQSDANIKHNAILCSMCLTPKNADEWLRNKDFDAYPEFIEFLENLYEQFNEVEINITELQRLEREVLNRATISTYTQFLSDKKSMCSLQDLRTETIAKIFYATRDAAQALNSNDSSRVYDVKDICAPLVHYVYQLQANYLLGVTSLLCYEMTAPYINERRDLTIDDAIMSSAVTCCQNVVIALQQEGAVKSQQAVVFQYRQWVKHYTFVCTAHYWLNENILQDMQHKYTHIVQRENLLNNVQSNCQSLEVWKQTIAKIVDDIEKHTLAVLHLYEVELQLPPLTSLYEDVAQQRQHIQTQQQTCHQLMDFANTMLRFELLKKGSNSLAEADILLMTLLQQWQDAYENWRQAGAAITPVELDIVQLLDPEGKVDQCWINNITGLLDDLNYNVQRQLGVMEREEEMQQETLQAEAMELQLLIESPIRVDTRHLLKSIVKLDKQPRNSTGEMLALVARVRELQHKLKGFYNKLAEMQLKLSARDYTESGLMHLKELARELLSAIEDRHNDFMQVVQRTLNNVLSCSPTVGGEGQHNSVDNFDSTGNPVDKDKKVNHKGQQQKRNAYAVSVWKRIRMKLEGRDPDPNRRSTVNEQVDYIIREAMNPDNLAVLYEGWTPWV